jgi:hypothetical protein
MCYPAHSPHGALTADRFWLCWPQQDLQRFDLGDHVSGFLRMECHDVILIASTPERAVLVEIVSSPCF